MLNPSGESMQNFTKIFSCTTLALTLALSGCGEATTTTAEPTVQATPRYDDNTIRFDRAPGELGYWANSSKHALVENGVEVAMNEMGLLANIEDASKVAPFMDWSLALYKYRQTNGLKDDPVSVCIAPAGPRHLQDPKGFRIIQDRNYERVYVMFGGGNRNWRLINMDGRIPPILMK